MSHASSPASPHADLAWHDVLRHVLSHGEVVAPRGQPVTELMHVSIGVDLLYPVIRLPTRNLNYRFMAAEALWVVNGWNSLEELTRYNSRMADFSDDGLTLAGAYGPRISSQLNWVVEKLLEDPDSRQATLTIWTPRPAPSKDIPCTVAMSFMVRGGRLHQHVYMRSSDAWLGLPYDLFTFACVAYEVVGQLRLRGQAVTPGTLYLTAASSHVYHRDLDLVRAALASYSAPEGRKLLSYREHGQPTPRVLWNDDRDAARDLLTRLREAKADDPLRWWEEGL